MEEDSYTFEGSVPGYYDRLFGEQLFEPYAKDLLSRLSAETISKTTRVLELGCGTGRCTQQIITQMRRPLELTATDISGEMLTFAKKKLSPARQEDGVSLSWQVVDECHLPYENDYFDMIVCQFGFMFCTDKNKAFAESVRVLRGGGVLLFNVWDRIETNPLCFIADNVIKDSHPDDHDEFFRLPYSMHDRDVVSKMLVEAGVVDLSVFDEPLTCVWDTAAQAAEAIIDGSPISLIMKNRGEELRPTLDKIAAAYAEYKTHGHNVAQVTSETEDCRVFFNMHAVVFMCFKIR